MPMANCPGSLWNVRSRNNHGIVKSSYKTHKPATLIILATADNYSTTIFSYTLDYYY